MRRFIAFLAKFILDARLRYSKAGLRLAIIALSVTLCGPVYSQLGGMIEKAQRGLNGPGPPGKFATPRPRAGKKQEPVGYKLFEQNDCEWIGKEYIDPLRTSRATAGAYLSLDIGARGYLDDQWRVHLVIDDSEALLVRGWEDQPAIKISGYDFSKTADGEALQEDGFFRVTGTDGYKSVEGENATVFVVEPLLIPNAPPRPVTSASAASLPYQRSWTNAINGRSITATYYGYESGTVNLVNSKNEVIGIPLEKLSTEDKSYVAKLMRIRRDVVEYNKWAGWRNPVSLVQKLRDP